ncbi:hypothetical protein EZV62_021183 [Acer yangbiense]|uniref:Subtilisin-like protease fibronectin type-III domain-containing protein n=1 Tax=Acer yangbiense TaxID=1000413 RepID=A0A5C7H4X4_9ROSI|nr:hypothetical protein EZV62_021183 [Acer yangbiense]
MKGLSIIFLVLCFFLVSFFIDETSAVDDQANINNGVYIVYMGAAASSNGYYHSQLLGSLLKRKENALVHSYKHGFSGFAARVSAEEALELSKKPGVVSVFPDPLLKLHTTRSWDFLKYQTDLLIDSNPNSNSDSQESDTIIGILDTGIWPESESFNDKNMGPIPTRWKGSCMKGDDDSISFNCNRKIIGAKFYTESDDPTAEYHTYSPRDKIGHGTHVAATAAGSVVQNASYYGLAMGSAKGGSPGSRIAMYRVCSPDGCRGSNILAAFDDAIADGVDVLSLSLGAASGFSPELSSDPIAIGAFHAVEQGITVVCSAGNDGPDSETVVNDAPWILTVAASTIDRDFQSLVMVGDGRVFKGEAINFSSLKKSPVHPLIYAKSAKKSDADEDQARRCNPESLDESLIKGAIVVCHVDDEFSTDEIKEQMQELGAIGVVVGNVKLGAVASNYGAFPMTVISSKDEAEILAYINSTRNPVATILPTDAVTPYMPAPVIAYFSSRGPAKSRNILKPDIAAPGVDILAAWMGNDTQDALQGKEPPLFNVISGTSMSCPHVSGIAANVKHQNPSWSPSAIRSAIMTTATQNNNKKAAITTDSGSIATPYDFGAGEISPTAPLQPGLVYETDIVDYLNFLCYSGYNISNIKVIATTIPKNFTCPEESSIDLISNINYPSISISGFKESRTVTRTATNVAGDGESSYVVSTDAPKGISVKVIPDKLQFSKNGQKLSYQVTFSSTGSSLKEDLFGSITWSNGKYKVRIPFVVSSSTSNKGSDN